VRDGPARRALKALALANFVVGLHATRGLRRLRGDKPYRLGGACQRCAACCEEPGVQVGFLVWYVPSLRRLFLWWQRAVNGFELVGRDVRARVFRFRCNHFDRATRSCDSYASRPGMCRDYPRVLLQQPHPELLPGCGYRAVAPNAERLLQVLGRAPLSPEQRGRLQKDLHLEP
jgi:uncharacterized protein